MDADPNPQARRGRPVAGFVGHHPVLVWDDYHGFVVGRRDALTGRWMADLPYAFECGGREIGLDPVLWRPLPEVPEHARTSRLAP